MEENYFGSIIVVCIVLLIAGYITVFTVNSIRNGYMWENTVNSYFELADRASSIDKKLEYLKQYRAALMEKGLNAGQSRYVRPTPASDLSNQMIILDTLIIRMEDAQKLSSSSLEYQQAIKQITTDEFQGFNSCVFANGWARKSVWRYLMNTGFSCQEGKYAGSDSDY